MIEISKRLQTIAQYIPKGSRVADIGSDHAYLPIYLIETNRSPYAVAGEVNEGPFQTALQKVRQAGLLQQISVRKGDGLAVIGTKEVDTIVIAGMGGSLITRILTDGMEKLEGIERLVLQPNVGEEAVRRFGLVNGWQLKSETILEEEQKIYEILYFERGDGEAPYRGQPYRKEILLKMGPYLIQNQNEIFRRKWEHELTNMKRVLDALSHSKTDEGRMKRLHLLQEYEELKEVLR